MLDFNHSMMPIATHAIPTACSYSYNLTGNLQDFSVEMIQDKCLRVIHSRIQNSKEQ